MTNEQKILNALTEHSELTKSELVQIVGYTCYANQEKHFSEVLKRLVDKKLIKRVKQGVYALDKTNFIDPKQTSLF